ncbi:hypothetical protein PCE1_003187 [Barthelona sp. PCE]
MSIQRLSDDVIGLISAGEVVTSAKSAIKELIENSMDAKATNIVVELDSVACINFKITDNGEGIRKNDKDNVCARHATSKIVDFKDIDDIHSFGFRGEALYAISCVSNVYISSQHKNESVGWEGVFKNGKLIEYSDCIRETGTTVRVNDLFGRLFSHRVTNDKNSLVQCICDFSINNPLISYSLIINGSSVCVFRSVSQAKFRIFQICGSDLPFFELNSETPKFTANVFVSSPDSLLDERQFSLKYGGVRIKALSLFVNKRRVHIPAFTECFKSLYSTFIKHKLPIVLCSLTVPGNEVDVNIHPNKLFVQLLFEHLIVKKLHEYLVSCIDCMIEKVSATQHIDVQKTIDNYFPARKHKDEHVSLSEPPKKAQKKNKPSGREDYSHVHVDHKQKTLDSYVTYVPKDRKIAPGPRISFGSSFVNNIPHFSDVQTCFAGRDSFEELLEQIVDKDDENTHKILENSTCLGFEEDFLFLQSDDTLYIASFRNLLNLALFQHILRFAPSFPLLIFKKNLDIREALEETCMNRFGKIDTDIINIGMDRLERQHRFFETLLGITMDPEEKKLISIPQIIPCVDPHHLALPELIFKLLLDTNFESELLALKTSIKTLVEFFLPYSFESKYEYQYTLPQIQAIVFPLIKKTAKITVHNVSKVIKRISNNKELFSIFERI